MDITETQRSTQSGYAGRTAEGVTNATSNDFAATIAGLLRDLGRGAQTKMTAAAVEDTAASEIEKTKTRSEPDEHPVEARPADDAPDRPDDDRQTDASKPESEDRGHGEDEDKDQRVSVDVSGESEATAPRPEPEKTPKAQDGKDVEHDTQPDEATAVETTPVEETTIDSDGTTVTTETEIATEAAPQGAEPVLTGLVASAQSASLPRQAEGKAGDAVAGSQRENSVDGLLRAQAAVTGNGQSTQTNTGQSGTSGQSNLPGQTGGQANNSHSNATQTATPQAAPQSFNTQAAVEAAKTSTPTTEQAAGIAKAVGKTDGTPIKIEVVNQNAPVTSQPSSTLSAAAASPQGAVGRPGATAASASHAAPTGDGAPMTPAQMMPQQAAQTSSQATQATTADGLSGIKSGGTSTSTTLSAAGASSTSAATATGGETAATAQTTQTSPQAATQHTNAAQAQRPTAQNQAVLDHVSVQIAKAAKAGVDKIEIQLRPASLGRIDVSLEVSHDGRVAAVVSADKQDTLDLLRQDAKMLEKALQDAGLQTDSGDLTFNLRGQEQQGTERQAASGFAGETEVAAGEDDEAALPDVQAPYFDGIRPDGRVDIRA